ncbi:SDR family oxidoreductase [Actinomadura barringtoniae]|uniref:SDR family oxidoreductase n=1 Tax=Actinomadura barringtoniae TaxID=1427535 RepID=A0A939P9A7_9ACTN|nr:SDR family oxidoreductase [Actinomadura barringtoniae]MBO2448497.1 SDR family oxidoreductase [Actinomadura barringtoniae]
MEKTALVTGGSRGIGRAIARKLAADGALVAVHYGSNKSAADATVADIQQAGGQAFALQAQFGTDNAIETLFSTLEAGLRDRTAKTHLDILVNNASIIGPGPIEEVTPEAFDHVFAINARTPFFIIQRALPLMGEGGRIINISSPVTRTAPPEVTYAMSKAALDTMSRTLAQALGPRGITVNTVLPGLTETDMMSHLRDDPEARARAAAASALGRVGQPADVADAVALLVSTDARWITGHALDATGGLHLRPS